MKNYKNPPIVEAEFSVSFRELISKESIERFKSSDYIEKNYSKKFENVVVDVEINSESFNKTIKSDGYLFNSGKNKIISIRHSDLKFISIGKYDRWESEITFLKEALDVLTKIDNSIYINSISCKFLNRILLPEDFRNDEAKYLAVYPNIPKSIVSEGPFILTFKTSRADIMGTVIENLEFKGTENVLSVDIFVNKSVKNSEIMTNFDDLRDFKNSIFQSLLRLETKILFEI